MITLFFWISAVLLSLYLFGASTCLLYRYRLHKKGYVTFKWLECFHPKKLFSVCYGFFIKLIIPEHIFEQMVIRRYDPYCRPNCLLSPMGACKHCGCSAEAKMNSPFEYCVKRHWGTMILRRKNYMKHREEYPISILLKFGKND